MTATYRSDRRAAMVVLCDHGIPLTKASLIAHDIAQRLMVIRMAEAEIAQERERVEE